LEDQKTNIGVTGLSILFPCVTV